MYLQHQLNEWSSKHHPRWLVVLRVGLGLSLFIKGIEFIQDTTLIQQVVSNKFTAQTIEWLQYVIPWIHLLGGVLIIIGLFTRWAVLVQIPILTGAVFFINSSQGVFVAPRPVCVKPVDRHHEDLEPVPTVLQCVTRLCAVSFAM